MGGAEGELSIGDVVRAWRALGAGDIDERQEIAKLLGYSLRTIPGAPAPPPSPASRDGWSRTPQQQAPGGEERRREPPAPVSADSLPELPYVVASDPVGRQPSAVPLSVRGKRMPRHVPEELLTAGTSRGTLAVALATDAPDSPLEVTAAVNHIAALRPLHTLPRLARPTLARGIRVYLDHGVGMEPFTADRERLVDDLRGIFGSHAVWIERFVDRPVRTSAGRSLALPPAGVPALVVSDLGAGGPLLRPGRATLREWLTFIEAVTSAGSSVTALVPLPLQRLPVDLTRRIRIMVWDRSTTVGTVAKLRGRR